MLKEKYYKRETPIKMEICYCYTSILFASPVTMGQRHVTVCTLIPSGLISHIVSTYSATQSTMK